MDLSRIMWQFLYQKHVILVNGMTNLMVNSLNFLQKIVQCKGFFERQIEYAHAHRNGQGRIPAPVHTTPHTELVIIQCLNIRQLQMTQLGDRSDVGRILYSHFHRTDSIVLPRVNVFDFAHVPLSSSNRAINYQY